MVTCSAFGCTNRQYKHPPGVTFHNFPKNETRRRLWVLAVRRKNFSPTNASKLCSEHFTEDMIDRTSKVLVRLRNNAVPTIFNRTCPSNEKKQHRQKQILKSKKVDCKKTVAVHPEETNKPQETAADITCDSEVTNSSESKKIQNVVICYEKDDCQLPLEIRDIENASDSEEEMNEKQSENVTCFYKSSYTAHNGIDFIKRKLEHVTALYEIAQKKRKLYEQKCKLYEKQISDLKVLHDLQLINSFSDMK